MAKSRVVITAVVVGGRSQSEVARAYGVSQGWVSRLVARYRSDGEAAFEPRSRRPNSSPTAIPAATVELIVRFRKQLSEQGLDAGPDTIAWHLQQHHSDSGLPGHDQPVPNPARPGGAGAEEATEVLLCSVRC